jgi:hypothetical protein
MTMSTHGSITIPPPSRAADLCKYFTLGDEAKKALTPEMTPEQFIQLAVDNRWHPDAVQFLAHYLPKRQAVFWAMTCAKQAGGESTPQAEAALKSAETWIAEPNEENRQAALKNANDAEPSTPAGATALAAYYSEGLPQTQDPKLNAKAYFMTAKLVAGAVLLAAVADREQAVARMEVFVSKGVEIAKKTLQR